MMAAVTWSGGPEAGWHLSATAIMEGQSNWRNGVLRCRDINLERQRVPPLLDEPSSQFRSERCSATTSVSAPTSSLPSSRSSDARSSGERRNCWVCQA